MSFFDSLFGSSSPASTPAASATAATAAPASEGTPTPAEGAPASTPAAATPAPASTEPQDPLDILGGLWSNKATEPQAPPSLSLKPEALTEVSGKLNFTDNISPESMQKLQGGDLSALPDILNAVARQAYSTALTHSTALVNTAVDQRSAYEREQIAPTVSKVALNNTLAKEFGSIKGEAVKQQLTDIANRMHTAYPDASPEQIAASAKQFLMESTARAMGFDPKDFSSFQEQQQQSKPRQIDWEKDWG